MKKILSIVLAVAMVLSMNVFAMAAHQTTVTYTGEGISNPTGGLNKPGAGNNELVGGDNIGNKEGYYYITVPASVTVGGAAAEVKLEGQWPANRTMTVSAPDEVTLTSTTNATVKAKVSFNNITLVGNDKGDKVSAEGSISVAFDDAAEGYKTPAFGTWTGTLTFNVQ